MTLSSSPASENSLSESHSPSPIVEPKRSKFILDEAIEVHPSLEPKKSKRSCTVCKLHGLPGDGHQKNSTKCPFHGHPSCYICKKKEYQPEEPSLLANPAEKQHEPEKSPAVEPPEPSLEPSYKIPKFAEVEIVAKELETPTSSSKAREIDRLDYPPRRRPEWPRPFSVYSSRDVRDHMEYIQKYVIELNCAVRRQDQKRD